MNPKSSVFSPVPLLVLLAAGLLAAGQVRAADEAEDQDQDRFSVDLYSNASRDENLFRLADGTPLPPQVVASGGAREDDIVATGLDLQLGTRFARQRVNFTGNIASERYSDNDFLNHVEGSGALEWDWQTRGDLDGTLGANYRRFFGGYTNRTLNGSETLANLKDLVSTWGYTGTANLGVGARWALRGAAGLQSTRHDAQELLNFDADDITSSLGLYYTTRQDNELGVLYSYHYGNFSGTVADFDDNALRFQWKLPLSEALTFSGGTGYEQRTYVYHLRHDYSGDVWNADLVWAGGGRTSVQLSGWRELREWQTAATDHYVSQGVRLKPVWDSGLHWQLALSGSWERDHYLGQSDAIARADTLRAAQAQITYQFLKRLKLTGGAALERRESSETLYTYDDRIFNVGLQATW